MAAGALRFALLLLAWAAITGGTDLGIGALAAAAAAWCSLHLAPPRGPWPRPAALAAQISAGHISMGVAVAEVFVLIRLGSRGGSGSGSGGSSRAACRVQRGWLRSRWIASP